ncbi:MAG TPA: T9SS type A sorting domain-containing protein, partial [Ignavibacteriaceae bacterium]
SAFNKAIENSLPNNKFVLGIKWGNDFLLNNNNWFINNGSLTIYVEYTPPTHLVTIDQRNSSNQQVGVLKKWEENILDWGDNFYPGSQFSFDVGSRQTIQGDQRLISNEKYNNWNELSDVTNHHSFDIDNQTDVLTSHFLPSNSGIQIENSLEGTIVNGGSIKFADPWYIDFQDGDYGNSWRNRGMQEPRQFYARSVGTDGWQPDFTTVYPESPYPYNGVFLNQPYTGNNPVYYSVQAINSQPIYIENVGTRNFYFHNWNASPVNSASFEDYSSATSAVVFNSDNAVISATLKGQGLSSNSEGFSTSSQRKIVRTSDGVLHRVYESLGHVWYEMSINNGQSWTIMNGGEPLDAGTGENPSIAGVCIDGDYNYVVVVFQQSEAGIGFPYSIQLNVFGGLMPEDPLLLYPKLQTATIYSSGYQYTHNEAAPSIAIRSGINTAGLQVVWHINSGLVMKEGGLSYLNNPPFSPLSLRTVSSTSSSSINPSIATYDLNNNGHFYLVWEENNSIKYAEYYASNFTNIQTISNLDGYTYNNRPSLIVLNDALSRICWKGTRYVYQIDPVTKTDNSFWDNRVVFRGINNNHFWYFGFNVSSPNINKADEEQYYALAWNENEYLTYFTDNSLGAPLPINGIYGSNAQLSNGPTRASMYADVFNTATTPYSLRTSNNLDSYYTPHKVTNYAFASGREGTVTKDSAHFYFTVGDILVDNEPINFVEIPDSIVFNSKEILNEYLVSDQFQLTDNSNFQYSIQFGITDSSSAAAILTNSNNYISFRLQLVDAQTSEVLGDYDEVTYDQSNIYQYSCLCYQVNTSGIGSREVYLRLVSDDNIDGGYSLGEIYSVGDVLEKVSLRTKNYDGLAAVTDYSVSQNYPNPFNPATTINYRLPQDGFVTLKIYDILGKEVATLVNEQKVPGRYSVNYDASRLASGVYIYQIRVNDYVSSKKMILVK